MTTHDKALVKKVALAAACGRRPDLECQGSDADLARTFLAMAEAAGLLKVETGDDCGDDLPRWFTTLQTRPLKACLTDLDYRKVIADKDAEIAHLKDQLDKLRPSHEAACKAVTSSDAEIARLKEEIECSVNSMQREIDVQLRMAGEWSKNSHNWMSAFQKAARTLRHLGYTDEGGEMWKPPLGKAPDFNKMDELRDWAQRWEDASVAGGAYCDGIKLCAKKVCHIMGWDKAGG